MHFFMAGKTVLRINNRCERRPRQLGGYRGDINFSDRAELVRRGRAKESMQVRMAAPLTSGNRRDVVV